MTVLIIEDQLNAHCMGYSCDLSSTHLRHLDIAGESQIGLHQESQPQQRKCQYQQQDPTQAMTPSIMTPVMRMFVMTESTLFIPVALLMLSMASQPHKRPHEQSHPNDSNK